MPKKLSQAPSNDSENYCVIENKEICLTPVTMGDKSLYNRIYTNAELLKFISVPLSLQSSTKSFETTLKRMSQKPMSLVLFAIRRQKNQQKIGVIGLKWNQSSKKCAEIGIVILQEYQGNGFGHQAKSLLIEYAFKNCAINKIVAVCDIKNHIANQANKKLGFVMEDPQIQSQQTKIRWIKYK